MLNKKVSRVFALFIICLASAKVPAQMQEISYAEAGYDADKLASVNEELSALYNDGLIPNYVVAAAKEGKIFYAVAEGDTVIGSGNAVDLDTRYQIASMTKPLVSVVILRLIEEGRLSLNDELDKFLPMFSDMFVAPGGSLDYLEEANRGITILDLLTHTSGLTYGTAVTGQGDVANLYDELSPYNPCNSNEENMEFLSQIPLIAQPGTAWNYSVGIDVLGVVVTEITGKSLYENISEIILEPLGMDRSSFTYSQEIFNREVARIGVSPVQGVEALGQVTGSDIDWKIGQPETEFFQGLVGGPCFPPSPDFKFESGGGGMTMSVRDYLTFLSMIANDGSLNGIKVLEPSSVQTMLKEQVANLDYPSMIGNNTFGAGFGIALDETDASQVDYYYWGGIFNTGFWINPSDKSVGVIATNVFPGRYNQTISLEQKFDEARLSN